MIIDQDGGPATLSSATPDRREHLLAEAATRLSPRLAYAEQLSAVAQLAAAVIGDWCILDVIEDSADDDDAAGDNRPRIHRVTSTAFDRRLDGALWEFEAHVPEWTTTDAIVDVLTSGRPVYVPAVSASWITEHFGDEATRSLVQRLQAGSLMIVPLLDGAWPIGALTIGTSTGRIATDEEFALAQLLADCGAAAIEAARLYRKAQRSTAARDAVLSVVSHDLIGTLGTVTMNARRLLDPGAQTRARRRRLCENILNGTEMMHRLLLDLADFSAIEMRRLTVTPVSQSLEDVLTSARDLFQSRAEAVGVQLAFASIAGLPNARFDATRILQVISNLLDNALKFTPVGGTVRVSARADTRDIVVSVADNGSGVTPDELPHVFERFWRAAKPGGRGLGLGLAIVQGVIEAHGGRVWMESAPGRGSTVFFTLPR